MVAFIPAAAIPAFRALSFAAGAGSLPFAGQGIQRERDRALAERESTGRDPRFRYDVWDPVIAGIRDPGQEGRSRLTEYLFGPKKEDVAEASVAQTDPAEPKEVAGPATDWDAIFSGFVGPSGGSPGVSVPSGLFNLSETRAEREMLARELSDIEARAASGEVALRAGWGKVQAANADAARKARAMVSEVGDTAAGYWTDAAQTARDASAMAAQQAGGFEGRAGIDVSPTAGSADWVGFMESQAPSERRLAERQQEMLGEDLDWMAGMASQQGEAYVGDLQRQSQFMSFQRASEHNDRVQDRINQERMLMAQMQMQAQSTNAQLAAQTGTDPSEQFEADAMRAFTMGDSSLLAHKYNIPLNQAEAAVQRVVQGLTAAQGIRNQ